MLHGLELDRVGIEGWLANYQRQELVRILTCGIASCLMLGPALGQRSGVPELTQEQPDSRTVLDPSGMPHDYPDRG